jgi:hypothetical protein
MQGLALQILSVSVASMPSRNAKRFWLSVAEVQATVSNDSFSHEIDSHLRTPIDKQFLPGEI